MTTRPEWRQCLKFANYVCHEGNCDCRAPAPEEGTGESEQGRWESDFSKLQAPPLPPWTSASCGGEKCSVCRHPATAKIGEEIMHDDPASNRHNLTAYVCTEHFNMVLRPYLRTPEGRSVSSPPSVEAFEELIAEELQTWDRRSAARQFVKVFAESLTARLAALTGSTEAHER